MQPLHFGLQLGRAAVVAADVVGGGQAFGAGSLAGDDGVDLIRVDAVAVGNTLPLLLLATAPVSMVSLEQQLPALIFLIASPV